MQLEEERLIQNLRMQLPGALDAIIKSELFNTCEEFFTQTNVWHEDVEFVAVPATREYLFENSGSSRIHRMEYVADRAVTRQFPATMGEPGVILLRDPVEQNTDMVARMTLSVRDPVDNEGMPQFPAWITQRYYFAFLSGTLSRLMSQPAKPYSNERMAVYHGRKFRDMMSIARGDARRANIFDGQRWRYPRTFR